MAKHWNQYRRRGWNMFGDIWLGRMQGVVVASLFWAFLEVL